MEKELIEKAITQGVVDDGVNQAFSGVVNGAFVEEHIASTVEVAGLTTEADDLEADIVNLKKEITRTRVASIIVWIACAGLFIGRFVL